MKNHSITFFFLEFGSAKLLASLRRGCFSGFRGWANDWSSDTDTAKSVCRRPQSNAPTLELVSVATPLPRIAAAATSAAWIVPHFISPDLVTPRLHQLHPANSIASVSFVHSSSLSLQQLMLTYPSIMTTTMLTLFHSLYLQITVTLHSFYHILIMTVLIHMNDDEVW